MADLRALLSQLGYSDVSTYLQSGNAVFSAPAGTAPAEETAQVGSAETLEHQIEQSISAELGLAVRCLIRDHHGMRAVIEGHPLSDVADNGSKMMAMFLSDAPAPALVAARDPVELSPQHIRVGDRVVYQWCPDGIQAAPNAGAFIEKHWKVAVTARNWNTVTRISRMLDE